MRVVFLSSTSGDLRACRDAAYQAIEGLDGYHCVRMEDFGAIDRAPDDLCRAKVAECDLFVCIVGPLYGSRGPSGLSYTEREFDAAVLANKPCLIFLTAEDFPLPADRVEDDDNRRRQLEFRKKAQEGRIVPRFSTPEQVSVKVVQAIRNWERSAPNNSAAPTERSGVDPGAGAGKRAEEEKSRKEAEARKLPEKKVRTRRSTWTIGASLSALGVTVTIALFVSRFNLLPNIP
ncbi:MAG TPA: DUF4062 domain-containing protein, partial [Roseiarcus sp.]|nr:DUF4062 domain-containing protein [Roseiarcus sp.]